MTLLPLAAAFWLLQQAPVPGAEQQKEAEALIRDVFKAEYSKNTAADRAALARKLLGQAQETAEPTSRFVLLREARDLAAQAGEVPTCLKATDLTAAGFAVDGMALKLGSYGAVAKNVRANEDLVVLAAAYLKLAEDASAANQYDMVRQAAEGAGALARRLKDLSMAARAEAKAREAADLREKYAKVAKAQEMLAASPDDPEANLQVGRFECWVKGDWERGLPRLAKGSDPAAKAAALDDLAAPSDVADQIKVGDGWWDLAEKAESSHKAQLQERARHWYRLAVAAAQGLTKARLEARLKGTWIPIFDGRTVGCLKESSQSLWEVADGALSKKPDTNEGFQTRQLFLDGEFRIRFEIKDLKHMTIAVRQGAGGKDALLYMDPQIKTLEGKVHEILFQCRGADVKAFLDGQPSTLYSRGAVAEGHIQVVGNGAVIKIFSLEYRQFK